MATYMRPLLNNLFLQNHLMTSPHSMISAWPGTVTNICTEYEKRKLHVSQQWPEEILVQLGAPVCILDFSLLETNATSVLMTKKQVKQPTIGWPSVEDCEIPVCRCHPVLRPHTHTHTHTNPTQTVGQCDTECDTGSLVTTQAPSHLIATPSPFSTLLHLLGVPQGSVLGHVTTLLFTQLLFLLKLKNTLSFTTLTLITLNSRNVLHNSYTDNSQLQKSMAPHHIQNLLLSMPKCIDDVKTWLTVNSTTTMKQWLYPLTVTVSLLPELCR